METGIGNHALRQYQQIGTANMIDESSPHRLIQLMMAHVLAKISFARGHVERQETAKKGETIGDAISVISGLQVSLNHKADAKMSANFDALYSYMMRRLLEANLNDDVQILDEVSGLMRELKEAWDAIADDPEVVDFVAAQI